ncbi:hypothetical protein M011DRAFT_164628 [Sporormia fimetaria CBS 119925]|uniref:Uncharacterized protein n=1 Tax=Sporormia fimetaria CBS 119925 TaxID=1340428 RepID=A0A6A6V2D5_9PLEO|nr:hypothetical protein M011DRAFT_164628 [Sporormia fimetaria CBS 119925]
MHVLPIYARFLTLLQSKACSIFALAPDCTRRLSCGDSINGIVLVLSPFCFLISRCTWYKCRLVGFSLRGFLLHIHSCACITFVRL